MESRSIETIIRTLNDHQIQYLIVGGLAVVAHGYVRFTAGVDLILAFDDLIELKTIAGRPRDLEDISQLRRLQGKGGE